MHGLLSCPNYLSNPAAHGEATAASSEHLGYFRYRVFCALGLVRRSGLLSTSVLLHLQTTRGHHDAPRRPQYYPKGIVGNLVLRNKWGFLQEHGHWDAHFGHRASRVRTSQIKAGLFVLLNIANTVSVGFPHLQSATSLLRTLGLHDEEGAKPLTVWPPESTKPCKIQGQPVSIRVNQ